MYNSFMKKKLLSLNCIILTLFCQIGLCSFVLISMNSVNVDAISGRQIAAITKNCGAIKQTLQTVRTSDTRARTYLGSYYEKIYSGFIVPLNLRLTRNNTPKSELTDLQVEFSDKRTAFNDDYINYQRSLEELANYDCAAHPSDFYGLLKVVREKRNTMVQDVAKMREIISSYVEQVKGLKNGTE